jgi:hypothetical protein
MRRSSRAASPGSGIECGRRNVHGYSGLAASAAGRIHDELLGLYIGPLVEPSLFPSTSLESGLRGLKDQESKTQGVGKVGLRARRSENRPKRAVSDARFGVPQRAIAAFTAPPAPRARALGPVDVLLKRRLAPATAWATRNGDMTGAPQNRVGNVLGGKNA